MLSAVSHNAGTSFQRCWEEKIPTGVEKTYGGNIPTESAPRAPQSQPCPEPQGWTRTRSAATSPHPCWEGHRGEAEGKRGTAERLCAQGPGPCCRRILGGRISVFAQLRTALPFPPIGELREHQVQRQGHQPAAFPTALTRSGQGHGAMMAGLAQWESWRARAQGKMRQLCYC